MNKGIFVATASILSLLLLLSTQSASAEPFIINDDGGGPGKGLEIGYLAGDFTCRIYVKNNDDLVTINVFELRGSSSTSWGFDDDDILVSLGPGDSYTYWINMTHPSTQQYHLAMQIVWVDGYGASDVENIAMDIDIKVWDPAGKEYSLEDLKDKDKVWDRYLETHGEDDDVFPWVPVVGSSCCGLLIAIIVIIVIVIILKKKRSDKDH